MKIGSKTKELWKDPIYRANMIAAHQGTGIKHGMSKLRIYKTWESMKYRCTSKVHPQYKDYRGRGIRLEWTSFEEFCADMKPSYDAHVKEFGERDTTIDRKDNDGNYNKKNCRWATRHEQNMNRRPRTHCFKGHELTPENTKLTYECARPTKSCRTCRSISNARLYQKKIAVLQILRGEGINN